MSAVEGMVGPEEEKPPVTSPEEETSTKKAETPSSVKGEETKKPTSVKGEGKKGKKEVVKALAMARELVGDAAKSTAMGETAVSEASERLESSRRSSREALKMASEYLASSKKVQAKKQDGKKKKKKGSSTPYGGQAKEADESEPLAQVSLLASEIEAEREFGALKLDPNEAKEAFVSLLKTETSVEVLSAALANLALHRVADAADAARPLLKHSDETIRADAARFLVCVRDASPELQETAKFDPSKTVRAQASAPVQEAPDDVVAPEDDDADDPAVDPKLDESFAAYLQMTDATESDVKVNPDLVEALLESCMAIPDDSNELVAFWTGLKRKASKTPKKKSSNKPPVRPSTPPGDLVAGSADDRKLLEKNNPGRGKVGPSRAKARAQKLPVRVSSADPVKRKTLPHSSSLPQISPQHRAATS